MEATELRIGNYILDEENEVRQVMEVSRTLISTSCDFTLLTSEVKPIPLTDELLIKKGFIKDTTNGTIWIDLQTHYLEFRYADGYYYPNYCQYCELSSESEQCVSLNRIKYLHQLQNIYHALTGKELLKI